MQHSAPESFDGLVGTKIAFLWDDAGWMIAEITASATRTELREGFNYVVTHEGERGGYPTQFDSLRPYAWGEQAKPGSWSVLTPK